MKRQRLDDNTNPAAMEGCIPGTSAAATISNDKDGDNMETQEADVQILYANDKDNDNASVINIDAHGAVNVTSSSSGGIGSRPPSQFILMDIEEDLVSHIKSQGVRKLLNSLL